MSSEQCSLCAEPANIIMEGGVGFCRRHYDELREWETAVDDAALLELGGPFLIEGGCPRRAEDGHRPGDDYWRVHRGELYCTYCGSLHPDTFMARVLAGDQVGPTDKSYKAYINPDGKFYFQHLSPDQRREFTDMYNDDVINVGVPGHFYTPLFFWERKP